MEGFFIDPEVPEKFRKYLVSEERSAATVEKYMRDVKGFIAFVNGAKLTKETVIEYKKHIAARYAVRSVNSMLASVNSLLAFLGWSELKVKSIKLQQQIYCPEEKELTREEYERLCRTAERNHNERLNLILQTVCGTGIRVSELQYITVEAVKQHGLFLSLKNCKRNSAVIRQSIVLQAARYLLPVQADP